MKFLIIILIIFSINEIYGQIVYKQEMINGGITAGGFSSGISQIGSGQFDLYIENGSIIKSAKLITYKIGYPPLTPISINGINFYFDTTDIITIVNHLSDYVSPITIYSKDITNYLISNFTTTFNITITNPAGLPINWGYYTASIIVEYENASLPVTGYTLIFNDKNYLGNESYSIENLNSLNTNYPIGISIFSDRAGDGAGLGALDATIVDINGTNIGVIGGSDASSPAGSYGAGVKGHFYYQNNQLFGLDDDIPNFSMDSTDGLTNIESIITNNNSNINLELTHSLFPNLPNPAYPNINLFFIASYTTSCDTFSTSVTDNINVCKGTQAQLNATGGASTPLSHPSYEWLPQVGLSCYNCPNPIVTADTINHYTCRIWNTDSCSKVLPVKINILPLPTMPTIAVNPTLCSGNTGHIHITNQPAAYTYTLDAGTPQTTLHFTNLSAGNHLLTIQAVNGCSIDTLLTVAEINNVVAQFTASPTSGDVPLAVNFTNQSANATNYNWYIENDTLNTTQVNHTFDTSGVFTVTLVAYNTYPQCSDTAQVTIVAEYPFTIIAPSLYVSDENYTPYQIYTSGVKELHYELFTDQGKLVYNKVLLPTNGNLSLWNSNQLAKGIYLYRIWAADNDGVEKVITGKVVVI